MREIDAETLAKYAYLWDGSDPGWVVRVHYHHQVATRIKLPESGVDAHFLNTLQALLPDIAHVTPALVRSQLQAAGCFDCGILESIDAHELSRRCLKLGLHMEFEDRSHVSHLLVNQSRNSALLIEDDALAFLLGEETLRRGVPSRHSTN